jgi:Uma2 family endonuclease
MTALAPPTPVSHAAAFANAAEWHRALGDVPLERIIFDPLPGTATEADLLRIMDGEKRLCELIDGTLVEKAVGFWEGRVAGRLIRFMDAFAEEHRLGAVFAPDATMRMKSGHVRLPDVSFISSDRLPKTREPIPTISPDLAVEVLSESNTPREIALKLGEFFQSGTRLAWVVDPSVRTMAVYHSPDKPTRVIDDQGVLDGEQVMPGLVIVIAEIFRDLPR